MSGAHRSAEERWRHARAAFVLGAIAVIALGLIAFVLSTQPTARPGARQPMLLTEIPTRTSATPVPATSLSRPSTPPRSTTPTASVPRPSTTAAALTTTPPSTSARAVAQPSRVEAPHPCGTSSPCVVVGTGDVQTALAAYRHAHGSRGEVAAVVTTAAQRCAATGGDGPSCVDPLALARVRHQNGQQAVDEIGSGYGNWLLDPNLRAVEVGWAYDPSTAQYICALIARM